MRRNVSKFFNTDLFREVRVTPFGDIVLRFGDAVMYEEKNGINRFVIASPDEIDSWQCLGEL